MMADPHPRDPAVDGMTPAYRGPSHAGYRAKPRLGLAIHPWTLPECQFNATDAAIAMTEDPSYVLPVPVMRTRMDMPLVVQCENLKRGVELGVQMGWFAAIMLSYWHSCTSYLLVDLWKSQKNYDDVANHDQRKQDAIYRHALAHTRRSGRGRVNVCRNYTTECAKNVSDGSVDWIWVDARHDRLGVLADLEAWWPKLRRGGLCCGHDYVVLSDIFGAQDWSINFDGSRDQTGLIVRGAVDDFFMTPQARAAGHYRQVVVTYREAQYNGWCVRK